MEVKWHNCRPSGTSTFPSLKTQRQTSTSPKHTKTYQAHRGSIVYKFFCVCQSQSLGWTARCAQHSDIQRHFLYTELPGIYWIFSCVLHSIWATKHRCRTHHTRAQRREDVFMDFLCVPTVAGISILHTRAWILLRLSVGGRNLRNTGWLADVTGMYKYRTQWMAALYWMDSEIPPTQSRRTRTLHEGMVWMLQVGLSLYKHWSKRIYCNARGH